MSRRAFTLVELVIVIAVLGILAALAYPAISNASDKSDGAAIAASIRTVILASRHYHELHGELPSTKFDGMPPEFDEVLGQNKWQFGNSRRVDWILISSTRAQLRFHESAQRTVAWTETDRILEDGDLSNGWVHTGPTNQLKIEIYFE